MKSLNSLLGSQDGFLKELVKHPRHKIIDEMWKRVNTDRVASGYSPLKKSFFAYKLSLIPLGDQHYLLKKMQQSPNPGKVFFGMLKVKKDGVKD